MEFKVSKAANPEKVKNLGGNIAVPDWMKGDIITAKKLNRTVQQLNKVTQQLGRSNHLTRSKQEAQTPNVAPDLIFRQEASDMPAATEEFPLFHARRPFVIYGVMAFATAGTYTVTLNTDTAANPDTDLISYADTDSPNILYLDPATDNGQVLVGEKVKLKVDAQNGAVENFQFNVLLRLI